MSKFINWKLCAVLLIVVAFLLKSCFEKKDLCSNDKDDILRRACDIELKKS